LFHRPPDTIQWFDPALLAAELDCAVVSDFRRADLAAGGQGAPLVPFADYLLFRDATRDRVLLNLGGIANITVLRAGGSLDEVVAFDTGPGNCILDALAREYDPAGAGYDVDGALASRGKVIEELLEECMEDAYFSRPPPKSTDGPAMIELFERARRRVCAKADIDDLLATATELTALTIGLEIERHGPNGGEVIVSGGGSANRWLMERLRSLNFRRVVRRTDELGVPSSAREAMAFALLGAATLDGEPSNVPSATGARRRVVLGSITPAP
jgi:anhydro-N-acetylmuramic acid kinase